MRELVAFHLGLVPFRADDPGIGSRMANARRAGSWACPATCRANSDGVWLPRAPCGRTISGVTAPAPPECRREAAQRTWMPSIRLWLL